MRGRQSAFEILHRLGVAAVAAPASEETLTHVADTLCALPGVRNVFVTYSVDQGFVVRGDSASGNEIGTSQIGLWIVQRQFSVFEGPVAFDIENKRVGNFAPAARSGSAYFALKIPTSESPTEMLIVRGGWQRRIPRRLLRLAEAAVPAVTILLERMLNAARGVRQKEHLLALANAADMLTQREDVPSVLTELATAVAGITGFAFATIGVYERGTRNLAHLALNRTRFSALSLEQEWKELLMRDEGLHRIGAEMEATREPMVVPDAQEDERVPESARDFARRSLLRSSITLPLFFGNELLGFLQCSSFNPKDFPPEEVAFMKGIAAQVATALKAMQMYRDLAESEKQLKEYASRLQASMEIQHRLARTDALTGIPNRRYIEEVIEAECARALRTGAPLAVAMLDVDGLKQVNDTYGHHAGDEVLVELAQLARRSCRKSDAVGRYGGDEFLFVLSNCDLASGVSFAERFRLKVEQHRFRLPNGETATMTASLGVAQFSGEREEGPSQIVAAADSALYEAKSKGGNRVCASQVARQAA